MAKKKRVVKKKAVTKKPAKKAHKKKPAKRSGRAAAAGAVQIKYRCVSGSCTASPKFPHMNPGDTVNLDAVGSDVTITFLSGSPFVSGTNPIHIASGTTDQEVVRSNANGHYPYRLACSACLKTSVANPEMIVP